MGSMVAEGDWAVTGSQEVEDALGVKGIVGSHGGYPLTSGLPWGCWQEEGAFSQPHETQKAGHF